MAHLATLITDLAWILIIAGITTLICKKLKQPVIIGYVLAGFLLSPLAGFFPVFVEDAEEISILAEIGVIFLMFSLGLEFNLHKMVEVGVSGTLSAAIQIVGMVFFGYLVGMLLGWSATDSLFLGGMLSMSSTIITVKALEDCGMRHRRFASLAIGTLIIEDIAAIFLMLVLSTVSVSQGAGGSLLLTIGKLLFYLALWLLLGIFLVPSVVKKISRLLNGETLLVVSLAMCFGMVLIADAIGFSSALGAFMAGSLLAGTGVAEKTEELVSPCKDLFVAVFFVSVGFLVVPSTLLEYIVPILILIVVTIIGKTLLLTVSYLLTRQDLSDSLHCALSQTQVGEFSFVIASLGLSLGVTGEFLYPVIVAVALLTTFSTPFLLRTAPPCAAFLEKRLPAKLTEAIRERTREDESRDNDVRLESSQLWKRYLRHYFSRLFLYVLICVGLLVLGKQLVLPFALEHFAYPVTKPIVMAVCILCILPFMPQLLRSHDPDYTALWMESRFNKLPLTVLMGARVAVGIGLLMLAPIMFFDNIHYWLLLLMIPIAVLAARSKRLRGSYLWIAAKFLANLNERQLYENRKADTLFWENKDLVVEVCRVPEGSPFIGRSLKDLEWGRQFHLNVIRLVRGNKIINLPSGDEILCANDELSVYGMRDPVENFRMIYEETAVICEKKEDDTLRGYILNQDHIPEKDQLYCYGTQIHKNSPFVNTSILYSGLKSDRGCFVIGVERDMLPIYGPSPNFVMNTDDVVWILGTIKATLSLLQSDAVLYDEANRKKMKGETTT